MGSLSGRVTDARGGGVANAIIIITDLNSGNAQRVVAGPDGSFSIATITPGTYRVEVESAGMRRAGRDTITITPGAPSQITVAFEEGTVQPGQTGTVEIQAVAPTIQTDSAEVSRAYNTRPVRSLPLFDRQYQELISLMPGVTPPTINPDRIIDPQRTRTFNVNGTPSFANSFAQDGTYINEQYTGNAARIAPVESIQQLNIRTANYNAEYGFAGGSWSNVVTRPGTNGVHGSLFGFNRNSYFGGRNPLNVAGNPDPRYNWNQFGGTIGMPMIANRLFFFGSYEGTLQRGYETQFATVPTADLRAGNFNGITGATIFNPNTGSAVGTGRTPFSGNQISPTLFNTTSTALLSYLPLPNQPGLANNLVANRELRQTMHRIDGKIDHRFSDRSYGFFRYGWTESNLRQGSIVGPLGDAATSALRNHNAVASLSQSYRPTLLAEYRVGFTRYRNQIAPATDFSGLGSTLAGLGFANGLPQINISGFTGFGFNGNYPGKLVNNNYTGDANYNWHKGINNLKFGVSVYSLEASGFDPGAFTPRGTFAFGPGGTASPNALTAANLQANSFASFLLGAPTTAGVSTFLQTPTYRQMLYAGYLTDSINLWQKLTLELGVRYDLFSPVTTRNNGGATFYDQATNALGFGNGDRADYDFNNVSPRVGIAFSPTSRLVFRGGYSFLYFPLPFTLSGLNQTAYAAQTGLQGSFGVTPFRIPTVNPIAGYGDPNTIITGAQIPNAPLNATRFSQQTPYVQSYSFMIQADLTNGFLFDVGYVGTRGRQLPYSRNLNAALPGAGIAGLPGSINGGSAAFYDFATGANNNYNSLQVNLTKRMANGLSFSGAYTWSKALDTGFNLLNPFSRNANYGLSDFNRQHVLAISHVWALPWGAGTNRLNSGAVGYILGGWELNGILRWATGLPYSATVDPLFCNCPGLGSIAANYSGTGNLGGQASFDPTLFSVPAQGTIGNAPRNAFRGPDLFNYNLALLKTFPVKENFKVELRGEAYNLTNSTNYIAPVSTLGAPNFGQSVGLYNGLGGRQFQVGARILF
jgi:hypothetical protein